MAREASGAATPRISPRLASPSRQALTYRRLLVTYRFSMSETMHIDQAGIC